MARLKAAPARVSTLGPRLATLDTDREGRRTRDASTSAQPWRAWYKLARWRELRAAVLRRDGFACVR